MRRHRQCSQLHQSHTHKDRGGLKALLINSGENFILLNLSADARRQIQRSCLRHGCCSRYSRFRSLQKRNLEDLKPKRKKSRDNVKKRVQHSFTQNQNVRICSNAGIEVIPKVDLRIWRSFESPKS